MVQRRQVFQGESVNGVLRAGGEQRGEQPGVAQRDGKRQVLGPEGGAGVQGAGEVCWGIAVQRPCGDVVCVLWECVCEPVEEQGVETAVAQVEVVDGADGEERRDIQEELRGEGEELGRGEEGGRETCGMAGRAVKNRNEGGGGEGGGVGDVVVEHRGCRWGWGVNERAGDGL